MDGLIGALIGWIAIGNDVINLNNGLRITNLSTEREAKVEVLHLDGSVAEYVGDDADAMLDRAESLCNAAIALTAQLDRMAAAVQPDQPVTEK